MTYIKNAAKTDVPLLARMNKGLIDDEKSENEMTLRELEERMHDFVDGPYQAFLILDENRVAGYMLVRTDTTPVYLRQFYIERHFRRRGIGTAAFSRLRSVLAADIIDVDVLTNNACGKAFWKSLGFLPISIQMRFSE
ncbi:MAG: GNAT family N-acetyltransferase [Spirochaetales bacterium]|nr:GNAT family N-acetyltransferase [Spirochaetales bacterium]